MSKELEERKGERGHKNEKKIIIQGVPNRPVTQRGAVLSLDKGGKGETRNKTQNKIREREREREGGEKRGIKRDANFIINLKGC